MTEPYLRRGPQPDPRRNGRRLVIGLVVVLVVLVLAVVIPLVVVGLHNNGTKPPPDEAPVHTTPTATR